MDALDFEILKAGGSTTVKAINDVEWFEELMSSFKNIRLD